MIGFKYEIYNNNLCFKKDKEKIKKIKIQFNLN